MATRLTGLMNNRGLARPRAMVRSWSRLRKAIVGGVVLLLVLAACDSTNTYPIDYFTAMHYQHGFRTLEPPRFQSPGDSVPVQGRAPVYSAAQILELENPIPADEASVATGMEIYDVNCAVCHGESGNGDGPMAQILVAYGGRPPAVLTDERLVQVADNHFYNTVTNGLPPNMPAYGNLIPGDDIWNLVNYIRTLQEAS